MVKSSTKKRLIEPKVRLLLWIYLLGIKNENNWRAKLSRKIDYSTGSTDTELMDLLEKGMIESLNGDKISPPYKVTDVGISFLHPILLTQKIGIFTGVWVALWTVIYFIFFRDALILMVIYWLPLLVATFIMLVIVLIFYPYLLAYQGKKRYPVNAS